MGGLRNAVYIYYFLSSSSTCRLQSILNAAARLISGIPKCANISGFVSDSLYWLPTQRRVQFKILSLIRNALVLATYLRSSALLSLLAKTSHSFIITVVLHVRTAGAHSPAGHSTWSCLLQSLHLHTSQSSPVIFSVLETPQNFDGRWAML